MGCIRVASHPSFQKIRPMLATLIVVFVLASFVGVEIISKVPQTLHTPLMSGSNAISGITVVGALVVAGMVDSPVAQWMGFAALVLAMINVVGGFLVTDRMLQMFRREKRPAIDPSAPARTDGGRP
jgi:NAD(P) transhydrogenase subunit alpha